MGRSYCRMGPGLSLGGVKNLDAISRHSLHTGRSEIWWRCEFSSFLFNLETLRDGNLALCVMRFLHHFMDFGIFETLSHVITWSLRCVAA